jgi:hypothetical protein
MYRLSAVPEHIGSALRRGIPDVLGISAGLVHLVRSIGDLLVNRLGWIRGNRQSNAGA